MKRILYAVIICLHLHGMHDGSQEQKRNVTVEDFWGPFYEYCMASYPTINFDGYNRVCGRTTCMRHANSLESFLWNAVECNSYDVIRFAFENCDNRWDPTNFFIDAMRIAIGKSDKTMIFLLLKYGGDFYDCDEYDSFKDIENVTGFSQKCIAALTWEKNSLCWKECAQEAHDALLTEKNDKKKIKHKIVILSSLWQPLIFSSYWDEKGLGPLQEVTHETIVEQFDGCYEVAQKAKLLEQFEKNVHVRPCEHEYYKELVIQYKGKHRVKNELRDNQRLALFCGLQFSFK